MYTAIQPLYHTAQPQFAPQGVFGDLTKTLAPVAGQIVGGLTGQQQLGNTLGQAVGQLGGLLPFSAGPFVPPQVLPFNAVAPQQFAPQNIWGNVLHTAGQVLPLQAAPVQFAPQGIFGDVLKTVAPVAGQVIGGITGQQQLGNNLGQIAGQVGSVLPFAAQPQFVPQSLFGDIARTVLPIAGTAIGGLVGQPAIGGVIGNAASQFIPSSVYGQPVMQAAQVH